MTRAVNIVLGAVLALGLLWTFVAATAQGAGGLAAVGVFFVVYALFAVAALFALWVLVRHPTLRARAGWILALPVIFWFLPNALRSAAGGVVSGQQVSTLLVLTIVAALAFAWLFPRRAARVLPRFLVTSRLFNWLVLLALPAAWATLIGLVVLVAGSDSGSSSSGTAVAYAIILAALYLVSLGAGSFGVSTWAWLSLRGGIEQAPRKLNIAQLCVAAPGVLSGLLVAGWLVQQGRL